VVTGTAAISAEESLGSFAGQSLRWHGLPVLGAPEAPSTSRRQPTPSWRRASTVPVTAADWSDRCRGFGASWRQQTYQILR
jgi:hypothetical protein